MFFIPGEFGPDVPFSRLHVWQWANAQTERANVRVTRYLQSIGFIMGQNVLTESQLQILEYAIEQWHRVAPHVRGPVRLADAFTPAGPDGFYVEGKRERFQPAPFIVDALQRAGWIHDVKPETTYFAVINGRLWAKYQQIIGSRCIAEVTE